MLIITTATECKVCGEMVLSGEMVLINHGFICENCCMEIAMSRIVKIETEITYDNLKK